MIELVAFLGNFGREYSGTRHNAAWLFEDSLAFAPHLLWQQKFKAEYACAGYDSMLGWLKDSGLLKTRPDGTVPAPSDHPEKLHFLKPLTYMNLSGQAVGEAARFFKIPSSRILVVHDEIELPLGTVSAKWSGGLGGHNGLRSAKEILGTADFWRLRLGIGKPAHGDVAGFVLGEFTEDERILLSQVFPQAELLLAKMLVSRDPAVLIPEWGKKKVVPEAK